MSELVEKTVESLTKVKNDLEEKVKTLNEEYEGLVNINHTQTRDDKKRIKDLQKEVAPIGVALEEINNDLEYISDLTEEIESIKDVISKMPDGKRKRNVEKDLNAKEIELQEFCENKKESDYEYLLNPSKAEKKPSKINKKKVAISAVAILAALGIIYGASKINFKGNNNPIDNSLSDTNDDKDNDNNKELEDKNDDKNQEVEPKEEQESLFTDINDEEKLLTRAEIITNCYDGMLPYYGMNIDYASEIFNGINGGLVKEASEEGALDNIRTVMELMNAECLYATDLRNKGESFREESDSTIDYGMFFLDETRAQKLATEISKLRAGIIKAPNSKEAESYAKEFTELLMNSWYNQGYNCINAYSMETAGSATIIDQLFLNTAMLVQANIDEGYNITVTNPLTGNEITLIQIIEEINKSTCQTEDGSYINKASQDINAMISEMISNKVNANVFTYGIN